MRCHGFEQTPRWRHLGIQTWHALSDQDIGDIVHLHHLIIDMVSISYILGYERKKARLRHSEDGKEGKKRRGEKQTRRIEGKTHTTATLVTRTPPVPLPAVVVGARRHLEPLAVGPRVLQDALLVRQRLVLELLLGVPQVRRVRVRGLEDAAARRRNHGAAGDLGDCCCQRCCWEMR